MASKFSAKHYNEIADLILSLPTFGKTNPAVRITDLAKEFCKVFKEDSDRFDKERFLKASGLDPDLE